MYVKKHEFYNGCDSSECSGHCAKCSKEFCKHCGLIDLSLTTECSGMNSLDKLNLILSGKIDYRAGGWRNGIKSRRIVTKEDSFDNEFDFLIHLSVECSFEVQYFYWLEQLNYLMELHNSDKETVNKFKNFVDKLEHKHKESVLKALQGGIHH